MFKKVTGMLIAAMLFATSVFAAPALENEINNDLKQFDGKVGIFAKNLKTGKSIDFNENDVFPTASTSKLVVALATYKYLYPKADAGKRNLYDQDIKCMMTVSDNAAFAELLAEIEAAKSDALVKVTQDLRMRKTQIHSEEAYKKYQYHSVTTPYDMARLFENIVQEKYLDKDKSKALKYELANTIYNDEIPRFMQTTVMHKVGQLDDILCDVGVVDDGKDQILISVYTITKKNDDYASDFIANLSAKLYNALRRK